MPHGVDGPRIQDPFTGTPATLTEAAKAAQVVKSAEARYALGPW